MTFYYLENSEKEKAARDAVLLKGRSRVKGSEDPLLVAENVLYARALADDPEIEEEDLVLYIYKGLGGLVKEFASEKDAKAYKTEKSGKKKK